MSANDKYRSVFKRFETDDEFRARVIAKSPTYYAVVFPDPRAKGETYAAWRARIRQPNESEYSLDRRIVYGESVYFTDAKGERLDVAAWAACKLQRRLVEDVSR